MDLTPDQLEMTGLQVAAAAARQRKQIERMLRTRPPIWKRETWRRRMLRKGFAYCFLDALDGELDHEQQVKELPPKVIEACEQHAQRELQKLLA